MYNCLKGNGLIAFSDPAGAKACLGLISILKNIHKTGEYTVISNKEYDFYKDWDIDISIQTSFNIKLQVDKPDWIFTGTSHPESSGRFELEIIKQAKRLSIPTWAFIDHWTALALRFQDRDGFTWPDKIIVLDDHAKALAIEDGIPNDLLCIHSNPYIDYIGQYWKPSLQASKLKESIGIKDRSATVILYAPDPLSLRSEEEVWGFNEGMVLKELLEILKDIPNVVLLIKTHPLQPKGIMEEVNLYSDYHIPVHFINTINNLELINIADLIIGFYSNFLIEAAALQKKIIRYFPKAGELDPIKHLVIGERATSWIQFANLTKNELQK
jgi:hypothetical protein